MNPQLLLAVSEWSAGKGLPWAFPARLLHESPWLTGMETMSEALAPQLLGDFFVAHGLGPEDAKSFCDAYNAFVERDYRATVPDRKKAFAAIEQVLLRYSPEHPSPSATLWLFDDSLSTDCPTVFVFDPAALKPKLIADVARAAALATCFKRVQFVTEDGDRLYVANL